MKTRPAALWACMALVLAVGCRGSGAAAPGDAHSSSPRKVPAGAAKVTPQTDAHPPKLHSAEWHPPVPVPGPVNTAGGEDSPFILPDGNTLYFWFTPAVGIPPRKQLFDGVTGCYVSRRRGGAWQRPERLVLQDAGKLALDGGPFVQGDTIWFCSAREGYTGVSYFTAERKDGRWRNWRYAGDKLNKTYEMGEMHITADGKALYFHSGRKGGKGKYDVWVSRKVAGQWGEPRNVEAVNSKETDGWPFVTADGKELWFTRWLRGTPGIFRSKKAAGRWQKPELILSQFAAEPSLDSKGNLYFAHHYYRSGKMIEADLYFARRR